MEDQHGEVSQEKTKRKGKRKYFLNLELSQEDAEVSESRQEEPPKDDGEEKIIMATNNIH